MSIDQTQWCDTCIDELQPGPALSAVYSAEDRLVNSVTAFFIREFPGIDENMIKATVQASCAAQSPDELFALRQLPVLKMAAAFRMEPADIIAEKQFTDRYRRMFDLHYARYEIDTSRNSVPGRSRPFKVLKTSRANWIEAAAKYAELLHEAACLPPLLGVVREDKPWLSNARRIIHVPELNGFGKGRILSEIIQAGILDVIASPLGRRHMFVWSTIFPERVKRHWEWLRNRSLEWPGNLLSLITDRAYARLYFDWSRDLRPDSYRETFRAVVPMWCPFMGIRFASPPGDCNLPLNYISWFIIDRFGSPSDRHFMERDHGWNPRNTAVFLTGAPHQYWSDQERFAPQDSSGINGSSSECEERPEPLRIKKFPDRFMKASSEWPETNPVKAGWESAERLASTRLQEPVDISPLAPSSPCTGAFSVPGRGDGATQRRIQHSR